MKLKKLMVWSLLVSIGVGIFVVQVWKQNQYVTFSKNQRQLERQIKKIQSEIVNIELDNERLKNRARLEKMGQEQFGLVYPKVMKFVHPKKEEVQQAKTSWFGKLFSKVGNEE